MFLEVEALALLVNLEAKLGCTALKSYKSCLHHCHRSDGDPGGPMNSWRAILPDSYLKTTSGCLVLKV